MFSSIRTEGASLLHAVFMWLPGCVISIKPNSQEVSKVWQRNRIDVKTIISNSHHMKLHDACLEFELKAIRMDAVKHVLSKLHNVKPWLNDVKHHSMANEMRHWFFWKFSVLYNFFII